MVSSKNVSCLSQSSRIFNTSLNMSTTTYLGVKREYHQPTHVADVHWYNEHYDKAKEPSYQN